MSVIDFALLLLFYVSLGERSSAEFMHGFAAFDIYMSVVFGKDIIDFVHRKVGRSSGRDSVALADSPIDNSSHPAPAR